MLLAHEQGAVFSSVRDPQVLCFVWALGSAYRCIQMLRCTIEEELGWTCGVGDLASSAPDIEMVIKYTSQEYLKVIGSVI